MAAERNGNSMAEWSIQEIKELMDKMEATSLGKIHIQDGDFELTISAKEPIQVPVYTQTSSAAAPLSTVGTLGTSVEVNVAPAPPALPDGNVVKSPIVGTFYASPAPDKPPFVQVGTKVKKGDVLFVIESMKLMNEIQSDCNGEVVEILVEDGQGVEYNQPILRIC